MNQTIIPFNNENVDKFIESLQYIREIIEGSYGPIGKKTLLIKENQLPFSTNDGHTILRNLKFEDKYLQIAQQILLNSANNINTDIGDGTSTSIILTAKLIEQFLKEDVEGSLENIEAIDNIVEDVKSKLKESRIPSNSKSILTDIAKTACRDDELAKMVSDFVFKLGKDGHVSLVYDTKLETEIFKNSFYVTAQLPDVVFFEDQVRLETKMDKPAIILFNSAITDNNFADIRTIVSNLSADYKDIVIISKEHSDQYIRFCKSSQIVQDTPNVFPLLAPYTGQKTDTVLDDMGVLLDCEVIDPSKGDSIKFFNKDKNLGNAKTVTIDRSRVIFKNPTNDSKKLKDRVKQVQLLLQDRNMRNATEFLKERERTLSMNFGVFYVSGKTNIETTDIYTRIEDAIRACQSALKDGVLEGGGYPLFRIANGDQWKRSDDIHQIIMGVLKYPTNTLAGNAGIDRAEMSGYTKSIDFATKKRYTSLVNAGIYDTYLAVEKTLDSAFSVLKQILLTNTIIFEDEDININQPNN